MSNEILIEEKTGPLAFIDEAALLALIDQGENPIEAARQAALAAASASAASGSASDASDDADAAAASALAADGSATAADASAVTAGNAATAAGAAQTAAETAQGLAEAAQSAAEGAQGDAETAQGLAEAAQAAAETAQGLAETAQTAAETAESNAAASAVAADADADRAEAAAAYKVSIAYKTWAELDAISGSAAQTAAVFGPDAGTHTDPVVGGTVDNIGVYRYSTSPAGWEWLGNAGLGAVDWSDITGKPSTFPPSAHNHDDDYYTEGEVDSLLGGKQDSLPSLTGNALKRLAVNAGEDGLEWADGGGWTQIGSTVTPVAVSQVDFTGIPDSYSDLLLVVDEISHDSGSSENLQFGVSADGATFSDASVSSSTPAGNAFSGAVLVAGYNHDAGLHFSGIGANVGSPGATTGGFQAGWRATGGITALRIRPDAGNFDAGSLKLFGR